MSSIEAKYLLYIIRGVFLILAVALIAWLISKDVNLSGDFSVSHDFQSPSPFITEFVPKQRAAVEEEGVRISQEPVYTNLRYPRPFQEARVELTFANPDNLFIEAGPLIAAGESFDLLGVYHPQLEQVAANTQRWEVVDEHLRQLRSASYRYGSTEQFLQEPPDQQETGIYGLSWDQPYLPDFETAKANAEIAFPLQGTHHFYVAVNQGDLEAELVFQDINNQQGADPVTVELKDWQGNVIARDSYQDDGDDRQRGVTTERRTKTFVVNQLAFPAVYQLSFEATEDIVLHRLSVSTPYLVVKGRVQLSGGPDYQSEFGMESIKPVNLFTNARTWTASTDHRQSLQSVQLDQERMIIDQPFESFVYQVPLRRRFLRDQGYRLGLEKGDLTLQAKGVFAFDQAAYFSPTPWVVDETVEIDALGLRYLYSDYQPVIQNEAGGYQRQLSLDLSKVFAPETSLRFQVSIPNLHESQSMLIKKMQVNYHSDPVTLDNAFEKLGRFWGRLLRRNN